MNQLTIKAKNRVCKKCFGKVDFRVKGTYGLKPEYCEGLNKHYHFVCGKCVLLENSSYLVNNYIINNK